MHYFPNKCKALPNKFCKLVLHNSKDKNISSATFDVCFDL